MLKPTTIYLFFVLTESRRLRITSCSDYVNLGNGTSNDNGEYIINPDPTQVPPFRVFCNFSGNVPGNTIESLYI